MPQFRRFPANDEAGNQDQMTEEKDDPRSIEGFEGSTPVLDLPRYYNTNGIRFNRTPEPGVFISHDGNIRLVTNDPIGLKCWEN
jgi:hypothetical protein